LSRRRRASRIANSMPGTSWSVTGRGIAGLRAAEAETPHIPPQPAVLRQTTAGPALVLPAVATLQCTAQHRRDLAGVGRGNQRAVQGPRQRHGRRTSIDAGLVAARAVTRTTLPWMLHRRTPFCPGRNRRYARCTATTVGASSEHAGPFSQTSPFRSCVTSNVGRSGRRTGPPIARTPGGRSAESIGTTRREITL
jgi:hypothetical protein